MPTSGNLSGDLAMTPLPQPQPQPMQAPISDSRLDPNTAAPVPPVYYGGKGGAVAKIADSVLRGWLAGTSIANQRKQQKMTDEVSGAKTGLDFIGQAYRSAVESGDPAKIKKAEGALSEAWNDYLNKAEQYAIPDAKTGKDGKPKKPGLGSKIKEGLMGGQSPHIGMAHSSLEMLRKTDPRSMYGPSKAEQQQAESTDIDLQMKKSGLTQQKAKDEAMKRYEEYGTKKDSELTAEQRKDRDFIEQYWFGRSKEQQLRDSLIGTVMNGGQLTEQQRQYAEAQGIIKPNVVSTQLIQGVDEKGRPINQIVALGPDGKMVGTPQKIGNAYVPPDQAQLAGRMVDAQVSALIKVAKKAHPEWDDKTAYQFALSSVAPAAGGVGDWFTKNQQADVTNRAINAVLQKHASKHKDPNGNEVQDYDQIGAFANRALVSPGNDGRYYYLSQLGITPEKHTHWFGADDPDTIAGMTQQQAAREEAQFLAELRAELKKQNPKMADSDLDKLVPQPLIRVGNKDVGFDRRPGNPVEQQDVGFRNPHGNDPRALSSPPGTQSMYSVLLANGQRVQRRMSPEYVQALKAQGLEVTLMGSGPDQLENNLP